MSTKRTHVVLDQELVEDIDRMVGARHRSSFLAEAARKELMRRRQIEALRAAAGAWKDKGHPEVNNYRLEGGSFVELSITNRLSS